MFHRHTLSSLGRKERVFFSVTRNVQFSIGAIYIFPVEWINESLCRIKGNTNEKSTTYLSRSEVLKVNAYR